MRLEEVLKDIFEEYDEKVAPVIGKMKERILGADSMGENVGMERYKLI
jgi:hypothetical protein